MAPDELPASSAPSDVPATPVAPQTPAAGAADARVDDDAPSAVGAPALPADEAAALALLRAAEARLSVGEALDEGELRVLVALLDDGVTPRVRATAAGVMAWLPGDPQVLALADALDDESADVRSQAALALLALVARAGPTARETVAVRAKARLRDASDEVACHAARLLASVVDEQPARAAIEEAATDASDVRHGCFRETVGLEPRAIRVAPPRMREEAPSSDVASPEKRASSDPLGGLGTGLFIATAATAGAVAGGFVVPSLVPPRDTLTYTRRTTSHAREEPSIALTLGLGLATSAAFAGAAYGVTWLTDGVSFAPAASTALMTVAGGAFGFGLALSLNLDQPWAGLSLISSTVGGLVVGGAMSLVLPPTSNDLTWIGATAGAFALYGTLLTYTIVPVGYPTVLFGAKRNDFAVGAGLVSGALGGLGALALAPVVDFSYGRLLAASGAALATTMTGLAVGYLFTPVDLDIRSRIAAGLGTGLGVVSGLVVFAFLPSSWAGVLERVDVEVGREAVVLDEGELKLGLPSVFVAPTDATAGTKAGTQIGVALFGGTF